MGAKQFVLSFIISNVVYHLKLEVENRRLKMGGKVGYFQLRHVKSNVTLNIMQYHSAVRLYIGVETK